MNSIKLYDKCSKSTNNKPIRFFETFFFSNSLDEFKKNFYPDKNDPESEFHKYPVTIDLTNESYVLEYEVADNKGPDEAPILEWNSITFTFENYLKETLKFQLKKSIELLENNIEKKKDKYKRAILIQKVTDHLGNYISVLRKNQYFSPYIKILEPLLSHFVRHIYKEYPSYAPKVNEVIRDIISSNPTSEMLFNQKELSIGIVKELTSLEYQFGFLFEFKDTINAKSFLLALLTGTIDKAPPIHFLNNTEAAYYILDLLSAHGDIKPKKIEKSKLVHFAKSSYTPKASYSNVFRFMKKNSPIKRLIDDAFYKHEQ